MKISKDAKLSAKQLFKACLAKGSLNEDSVRLVIQRVGESKPRGYLSILDSFVSLVKNEINRNIAIVEFAVPLSDSIQQELLENLQKRYQRSFNLEYKSVPELIGGFRVRVGSDVWDGSIKARLNQLQRQFA
jgi:F-type H+-transporting ATPase subunit delta